MVSRRMVLNSILTRVLPTSAFLLMVGVIPVMLSGASIHPLAPLILLGQAAAAGLGFGALLLLVRRRLRSDTPLLGRPAIVAGVVLPMVNLLTLMASGSPHNRWTDALACGAGGAVLALGLFFPWLHRPPTIVTVTEPEFLGSGAAMSTMITTDKAHVH